MEVHKNSKHSSRNGYALIDCIIKFQNAHKSIETLVNPISGQAKVIVSKKNNPKIAKYKCSVGFESLGFGINNSQFSNFFVILEKAELYIRAQKVLFFHILNSAL